MSELRLKDGRELLVRESGLLDRAWTLKKSERLKKFLEVRGIPFRTQRSQLDEFMNTMTQQVQSPAWSNPGKNPSPPPLDR